MVTVDDIDTAKESEPEPEPDESGVEQPRGGDPSTAEADQARSPGPGPGPGAWAAIAVGVVILVVVAAAIGYFVGRGNDSTGDSQAAGTSDTARTDQKLCTELLGAQQDIAASGTGATPATVADAMRTRVAGVLSDSPPSAVTTSVQDAYAAAVALVSGGDPSTLKSTYVEKLAIAQYQCDKIATWDWPAI